jgi:hypothetical protein
MVKAKEDKESKKLIARCLLFDPLIWHKVKELAQREDRSISSYLRNQIKVLYDRNNKLSSIS